MYLFRFLQMAVVAVPTSSVQKSFLLWLPIGVNRLCSLSKSLFKLIERGGRYGRPQVGTRGKLLSNGIFNTDLQTVLDPVRLFRIRPNSGVQDANVALQAPAF